MKNLDIEKTLQSCEFFEDLDTEEIRRIAGICHVETFQAGEKIFCQGDFGEHLYVISEGSVFLERSTDLGKRKGSVLIAILGKGRGLGCWSTLLGESHNLMSSATCRKATKVLALKGSDLRDMMISNTDLGFRVLERLCFLLRDRIQWAYGAMEKI